MARWPLTITPYPLTPSLWSHSTPALHPPRFGAASYANLQGMDMARSESTQKLYHGAGLSRLGLLVWIGLCLVWTGLCLV